MNWKYQKEAVTTQCVAQNSVCVFSLCDCVCVVYIYVQISACLSLLYKVFKAFMSCLITHKLFNGDRLAKSVRAD